jgi:long-subunit acyl-CoA synthetase (AMP-forming)
MQSELLQRVADKAAEDDCLLISAGASVASAELFDRVGRLAGILKARGPECVGLMADNGIDWIVTDLACQEAGIPIVPIPLFFSPAQMQHSLVTGGVSLLLTDRPVDEDVFTARPIRIADETALGDLRAYALERNDAIGLPAGTGKITYTSGTTGQPKGVCLTTAHQVAVASSIAEMTNLDRPRHLCVLPLSTLLENLAGVYAPLLAGGSVIIPPMAEVGLHGSSQLDVQRLLGCITDHQPDSLIVVPEILVALTAAAEHGWRPPASLCFVAVGGSKVSGDAVLRARNAGLPVFEGYGLSECGSVVALNAPGFDRPGSVGRPLPHVEVLIENGEIIVSGSSFLGYAGQPESWHRGSVRTGDLGRVDAEGFVHISGRLKNQLITSYGRNVSPEWIESELLSGTLLQQAVVVGDARPWCVALLLPLDPATIDADIDLWVRRVNRRLPDYARIVDWQRLTEPMTAENGLMTSNGRPKRTEIERACGALINQLYDTGLEASIQ